MLGAPSSGVALSIAPSESGAQQVPCLTWPRQGTGRAALLTAPLHIKPLCFTLKPPSASPLSLLLGALEDLGYGPLQREAERRGDPCSLYALPQSSLSSPHREPRLPGHLSGKVTSRSPLQVVVSHASCPCGGQRNLPRSQERYCGWLSLLGKLRHHFFRTSHFFTYHHNTLASEKDPEAEGAFSQGHVHMAETG